MKKNFLKILVTFILLTFLCVHFSSIEVLALHPNCDKFNKYGQFEDETCAIADSIDKISNGEKFIKLNNVGGNSEYDLLFFDSSEINGILSNLTYNKNIDQIIAMKAQELENSNEAISEWIFSLGIGGTGFNVLKNIYNALNLPNRDGKHNFMQLAANPRLIFQRIQNVAIFIPLVLATGVSALISGLACSVNSYFSHKSTDEFLKKSNAEYNNYFDSLRMILDFINNGALNINNILCLRLKTVPAVVRVLDKNSFKDISVEEQNKFNEDILNLKEEIVSILTEAKELR